MVNGFNLFSHFMEKRFLVYSPNLFLYCELLLDTETFDILSDNDRVPVPGLRLVFLVPAGTLKNQGSGQN